MEMPTTSRPRRHAVIASAALVWNLIGLLMLVLQVSMRPEQIAALPAPERAVYQAIPWWLTTAFMVAVGTGVLGSIGLLLRKPWAVPNFAVSIVALLVQGGGTYLATPAWQASGPAGTVMPVLLVTIAILLLQYARRVAR